jgi:hypothetical protein
MGDFGPVLGEICHDFGEIFGRKKWGDLVAFSRECGETFGDLRNILRIKFPWRKIREDSSPSSTDGATKT